MDTRAMLGLRRGHLEVAISYEHLGYAWVARESTSMTPGTSRVHLGCTEVTLGCYQGDAEVTPGCHQGHAQITPG